MSLAEFAIVSARQGLRTAGLVDPLELAGRAALLADLVQTRTVGVGEIIGAGLVYERDAIRPLVVIAQELTGTATGFLPLRETPIPDILGQALQLGPNLPEWLLEIAAFVIPSPEPQISAGGSISSPNIGTVGCQVSWTGGSGFLTAGHVAPTAKQNVYDGRNLLGTVQFANNPAQRGTSATADVAVVELSSTATFSPKLGSAVAAGANSNITVKTTKGNSGTIMGLCSFLYWPKISGTYGDTYLTTREITVGGDSGSVAVDNNGDVVGMVVGGSAGVTSFIQDVRYQLNVITKHSTGLSNLAV